MSSSYRSPFRRARGALNIGNLANSVGIIDSGYRGNILAAVDNIWDQPYDLKKGTRLFQICAPDLTPINVELVDSLDETVRGAGGFGSTGQ